MDVTIAPRTTNCPIVFLNFSRTCDAWEATERIKARQFNAVPVAMSACDGVLKHLGRYSPLRTHGSHRPISFGSVQAVVAMDTILSTREANTKNNMAPRPALYKYESILLLLFVGFKIFGFKKLILKLKLKPIATKKSTSFINFFLPRKQNN